MNFESESVTIQQLLQYYVTIIDELRARKVVRTANSPIGDYAEWLVANKLGLSLVANSTSGYDAIDPSGTKFQIKSRRITSRNPDNLVQSEILRIKILITSLLYFLMSGLI